MYDRLMKKGIDPSNELTSEAFKNTNILFTSNPKDLKEASFHIIAVPTPTNIYNLPDLTPLLKASETVGKVLKKGDYVVYESTVYPGCTEEDCVPVLERYSNLKLGKDFKVGFSPERINPGDQNHTLTKITKVTSGCDAKSAESIAKTYELIIQAGVYRASSIKVAEIEELADFGVTVDIIDPGASAIEVKEEYGLEIKKKPEGKYDAVILAVSHKEYVNLDESFLNPLLNKEGIVVDVKGLLRGRIKNHTYWSL